MDDEQPLTFNDPQSDSDTTDSGHSSACLTPQVLGSPQDTMEVHVQDSEVEEAVQVCSAYYHNRLLYVKNVLLHHLIIPLLDLIQSPYHGIVIMLVAKCPLHVHQQVPHRDVFALVQHAGPFTQVPMETGEDVGVHTGLIILLKKGIYVEVPECVHHLHPWISQLKDRHIQSCWHQPFPFPTSSAASVAMPAAHSLTCSGVSIRVWHSLIWRGRG